MLRPDCEQPGGHLKVCLIVCLSVWREESILHNGSYFLASLSHWRSFWWKNRRGFMQCPTLLLSISTNRSHTCCSSSISAATIKADVAAQWSQSKWTLWTTMRRHWCKWSVVSGICVFKLDLLCSPRLSVGTKKGLIIVDILTNKVVEAITNEKQLLSEWSCENILLSAVIMSSLL